METIKSRGLEESFTNWKKTYVENLWQEFGAVPMNPETEETEEPWKHFSPGTDREEIWNWGEEKFNISVGKDLMGVWEKNMQRYEISVREILKRTVIVEEDNVVWSGSAGDYAGSSNESSDCESK